MSACEKCWRDAHRGPQFSVAEEYARLLAERVGPLACTPEEQAGPAASRCDACGRMTLHQITRECMNACARSGAKGA